MVGEVRLAGAVEPRDRGHQLVVHPEPAHRVVGRRVDAHRDLVRVLVGDALVHLEEVPVALLDDVDAEAADRIAEVEVHAVLLRADAVPGVDLDLGGARRDVAGREVAEARVPALEVVVAVRLGDLVRRAGVVDVLRHPDAAVVAQRLRHQRELRLELVALRDARRVDLRVAGVGERRAPAVGPPRRGDVAGHRVGGEEEDVGVAAGGEDDGVGRVARHLAGLQVAHDDAGALAVDDHDVDQLHAVVQLDVAEADLAGELLVDAEQQLLAGLAACVERAGHLGAAERAVVEQAAVLAGEGHALGGALVDDVHRLLGQPVDVGLTAAEVAALDRVVEEALDRVAVVVVVLGGVDAALGGDRVGPARRVVEGEHLHLVAQLGERGRGRRRRRGRCRPR